MALIPSRKQLPAAHASLRSQISRITEDGTLVGWCWFPDRPNNHVLVEVLVDDVPVGTVLAREYLADLAGLGIGQGDHLFSFRLPRAVMEAGNPVTVSAREARSHQPIGEKRRFAPILPLQGNIDQLTEDGWLVGWCWRPSTPESHQDIEVLVDGVVAGSTIARLFRADLKSHGVGAGDHGFTFALPAETVARPAPALITVRDRQSREMIGGPQHFLRRVVRSALDRVQELEDQARLLQASLDLMQRESQGERQAAAELFSVVADFFRDLSEAAAAGKKPAELRSLRSATADVLDRLAPLELPLAFAPQVSLCVEGGQDVAHLHYAVSSLAAASAGMQAEIILLDEGFCDEAALLPLAIRNLRYVRGVGRSAPERRNLAAAAARGNLLIFLAADLEAGPHWLAAMQACFAADPGVAVVGGKVVGADGMLEHAGLAVAGGRVIDSGRGKDSAADMFAEARDLDAVTGGAFAVRTAVWRQLGGFDELFTEADPSLIDFCLRAKAAGHRIRYEPRFAFAVPKDRVLHETAARPSVEDASRLLTRLAAFSLP